MEAGRAESRFWGDLPGGVGQWRFVLGPLSLAMRRSDAELWVAAQSSAGAASETTSSRAPAPFNPPVEAEVVRLVGLSAGASVALAPALADRPVVARPQAVLQVAPGGEVRVFVSTPLWAQVRLQDAGAPLHELPTLRPSDTWLGPNFQDGELCYASRTRALTERAPGPLPSARALTVLDIHNRGADVLRLERVKLPVPNLALYADDAGEHWTDSVRVVRGVDGELEGAEVVGGPPDGAPGAQRVSEPREAPRSNLLARALAAMLDQGPPWKTSSQVHESS